MTESDHPRLSKRAVQLRKLTEVKVRELIRVVVNEATNQNSYNSRTLSGHDMWMSAYQLVSPSSATAQHSEIGTIRY